MRFVDTSVINDGIHVRVVVNRSYPAIGCFDDWNSQERPSWNPCWKLTLVVCVYVLCVCVCVCHFHFIVLQKEYALYNSWSHLKYMGWSQKCKWISDVSTTRIIQPVDRNMTHLTFNILMVTGHKTPAIAMCFTFYTTLSPLGRKCMEERRERVIRLSSDSFFRNYMVDYFGELWCR